MTRQPWYRLSVPGLLVGALFFAGSLTPSLVPRTFLTQGVVSGLSLAAGYCVGLLVQGLWIYLEIPRVRHGIARVVMLGAAALCAMIVLVALFRAAEWQNSIGSLMNLPPVETAYPVEVTAIALAIFALLLVLGRIFRFVIRFVAARIGRFLPKRVAILVGVAVAAVLFAVLINGALFQVAFSTMEATYEERNRQVDPDVEAPTDPEKSGSSASLLSWKELGRWGRVFAVSGPTKSDISAFSGRPALEPLRVYVGLQSADSAEARARLALEELKRVGGFDRSVLIIVTPTGSGWVDASAMDGVEYLHNGDVASVAVQYSHVSSWLYLLSGIDYGLNTSRALFAEVYSYWATLPKDHRPKLVLFGLSLGSKYSAESMDLSEVLGDPFNGALWVGPPFLASKWRFFTENRNLDSPAWLPRFRDGSFVRFMNQNGDAARQASIENAAWGPIRVVYLQYASDPSTFFEPRSLFREPDWMRPPRGPDVSPQLRWYPVISALQLAADIALAMATAPIGFGHLFAPAHYLDAWIEVTDVQGWSADDITRLKAHLSQRH